MNDTPSAFSVSHYILLFLVSTICTVSVVWVLIAANNRESALRDKNMATVSDVPKSCQKDAADKIILLWETNYDNVPQGYKIMELNYANRVVQPAHATVKNLYVKWGMCARRVIRVQKILPANAPCSSMFQMKSTHRAPANKKTLALNF